MTGAPAELAELLGPTHVFAGEDIDARYCTDITGRWPQQPALVIRPETTEQVAAAVRIAARDGLAITAQGGRTSVVGGAIPIKGGLVLSLERMRRVIEVDPIGLTMTVEAGATIEAAQQAAEDAGLMLPLDLGARGTATVGGAIATNAGGLRVLRYGMMREMVLGAEAVLADGTVVSGLRKSLKDNAGYDWKHLLIGSEGTLGIVTKATLRLRPRPRSLCTALLGLADFGAAVKLLRTLDERLAGALSSFELMWQDYYAFVTGANAAKRCPPLPATHACYALIETQGSDQEEDSLRFESLLAELLDSGVIADAVIGQSGREREDLWAVREDLIEPFGKLRPMYSFDVSMALDAMPAFKEAAYASLHRAFPEAVILTYGHAGDGNLHLVVSPQCEGSDAVAHAVHKAVYRATGAASGSISAEHGIGLEKRDWLFITRSPAEIALMRSIKAALDPLGILNPGKILPDADDLAARCHP